MEQFFQLIAQFGFPIVVAVYLLYRMEKKIEMLIQETDKINETADKANGLAKAIKEALKELKYEVRKACEKL